MKGLVIHRHNLKSQSQSHTSVNTTHDYQKTEERLKNPKPELPLTHVVKTPHLKETTKVKEEGWTL